jgi:hypothetical protein
MSSPPASSSCSTSTTFSAIGHPLPSVPPALLGPQSADKRNSASDRAAQKFLRPRSRATPRNPEECAPLHLTPGHPTPLPCSGSHSPLTPPSLLPRPTNPTSRSPGYSLALPLHWQRQRRWRRWRRRRRWRWRSGLPRWTAVRGGRGTMAAAPLAQSTPFFTPRRIPPIDSHRRRTQIIPIRTPFAPAGAATPSRSDPRLRPAGPGPQGH